MMTKMFQTALVLLCATVLSGPSLAQGQETLARLQKEPVTLFDLGMKSLRRLALDATANMAAKPGMGPSSSVRYKHAAGIIEIEFNLKTENANSIEQLRQQCLEIRRKTILKVFRIGLSDYTSQLSVNERIRRRIGGQFAHEPLGSMTETQALGEQLGQITYFAVNLTTATEPAISVSCRALATDSMAK